MNWTHRGPLPGPAQLTIPVNGIVHGHFGSVFCGAAGYVVFPEVRVDTLKVSL